MSKEAPTKAPNGDFGAGLESWEEMASGSVREEPAVEQVFDLEERTARFGEAVIDFCKLIPRGPHTDRLIDQLTGSGTAIGANYCEADDAVSKREFIVKTNTCRKEAREAKFFIRMIARACPNLKPVARQLWQEARELHLIFCAIYRKSGGRSRS
jgi:four helix bundle protein